VSNTLYLKENTTGCGIGQHHEAAHRKLNFFESNGNDININDGDGMFSHQNIDMDSGNINLDSGEFIPAMHDDNKLSHFSSSFLSILHQFSISSYQTINHYLISNSDNNNFHNVMTDDTISRTRSNVFDLDPYSISFDLDRLNEMDSIRSLGGGSYTIEWKIHTLNKLLHKSVWLLCASVVSVMMSSMIIGYSMPHQMSVCRVNFSRIGAVIISLLTFLMPLFLKSIASPCLLEADGIDEYSNNQLIFDKKPMTKMNITHDNDGISVLKALSFISIVIFISFLIGLLSIDKEREALYAKLEEEAHYQDTVIHLSHMAKNFVNVLTSKPTSLSFRFPFLRSKSYLAEKEEIKEKHNLSSSQHKENLINENQNQNQKKLNEDIPVEESKHEEEEEVEQSS